MSNNYLQREIVIWKDDQEKQLTKKLWEIIGEKWLWMTGKMPILSYSSCKKLFLATKLKYVSEPKLVCTPDESNKQQHIWIMWMQDQLGNIVYSDGEASKYNTGKLITISKDGKPTQVYSELTEIDAKYRSRMAFKRAFCRCVMDILGLEEFYSETDSTEFKRKADIDPSVTDADLIESL